MNQVVKKEPRPFSVAIQSTGYRELINRTLTDAKRASRFIATISAAVATNPALQECDAGTILSSALMGEALNLSPSAQLGQFYLVPYKKYGRNNEVVSVAAQFQIGYKGYIQLAIRSGYYKKINVLPIKDGELIHFDPLNEEIELELIDDEFERENTPTMGYYAMFEYLNGFRKAMYWSREKMMAHADKYSQAFNRDDFDRLMAGEIKKADMWKYSSFWYKNFDDMALKTMLRQLLSRWGILSTELQTAMEKDMGTISPDGSVSFIDNEEPAPVGDIQMPTAKAAPEAKPETAGPKDEGGPGIDQMTGEIRPSTAQITALKRDLGFKKINFIDACAGAGVTAPNSIDDLSLDAYTAVTEWVKVQ